MRASLELFRFVRKPALRRTPDDLGGIDRRRQLRRRLYRFAGIAPQGVEQGGDRPALQIGERAQGREADPFVACRIEDRRGQTIDDRRAPRAPKEHARRRRGGSSDCRVRCIDRGEHRVDCTRIGNGLEGAERRRARTGRGVRREDEEQTIDCPRAHQCQPCDRRLARGRPVRGEIGSERLDLAG